MLFTELFEGSNVCPKCGQTPCNCTSVAEEKVRLDPKCWTGKKIGNPKTKVKGGVRVNNCVPAESVAEGAEEQVGFHLDSERAYQAVMARFGDMIDQDEDSGTMYVPARLWPKIEQVAYDADGIGAQRDDGLENPEHYTEGMLDAPGQEDSPVAQAIIRRILMQRTDLLAKHGPEKVGAAVDEVSDFVGDVEEIGSSDVSGWVRHVEQMLGNMGEQGVAESLADEFMAMAKAKGMNPRLRGTPDEERARTDAMLKQRAADRANAPAPAAIGAGERARLEAQLKDLEAKFDPSYDYSDDHSYWTQQRGISQQIGAIKQRLKQGMAEGKPEADYGDDYQQMVLRLKKLAGAGPLKTVWDPAKRVYKNVPTAVQPAQQPKK